MEKRKLELEQPDEQGQQRSQRRHREFSPISRTGNTSTAERGSEALQGYGEERARHNVSETGESSSQRQNQELTTESIKDFDDAKREEIKRKIEEDKHIIHVELDRYKRSFFMENSEESEDLLSYSKQTIIDAIKDWPYGDERWTVYQQFINVIRNVLPLGADDFIKGFFVSEKHNLFENIKDAPFTKKWAIYMRLIKCIKNCTSNETSDKIAGDLLAYTTRDIKESGKSIPSHHKRLEFYCKIMECIRECTSNDLSDKIAGDLFTYEARDIKEKTENMAFHDKLVLYGEFINYSKKAFFSKNLASKHINDLLSYEKGCIMYDTNNKFYNENYIFHDETIENIKKVLPKEWSDKFLADLFSRQINNILENTKDIPFNNKWNIYNNFIEHTINVLSKELADKVNYYLLGRIIHIITEHTLEMSCEEKWTIYNQYIDKVEKTFPKETFLHDPESSQQSEADPLEKLRRKRQTPSSSLLRSLLEAECSSMEQRVRLIADYMTSNDFWDINSMLIKRSKKLLPPSTAAIFIDNLFYHLTKKIILDNIIWKPYDKRFIIYSEFLVRAKKIMRDENKYKSAVKDIFNNEINNIIEDIKIMSYKDKYTIYDLDNNLRTIHNLFIMQVKNAPFNRRKKEYLSDDSSNELINRLFEREKLFIAKEAKNMQTDKRWCLLKVFAADVPQNLRADFLKELYSAEATCLTEEIRHNRTEPEKRWDLLKGFAEFVPSELRADILKEPCRAEAEHIAEVIRHNRTEPEKRWDLLKGFAEFVPSELRADALREPCRAEAEHIAEVIQNEGEEESEQRWDLLKGFAEFVPPELSADIMLSLYNTTVKKLMKDLDGKSTEERLGLILDFRDIVVPQLRKAIMPVIYSKHASSIVTEMLGNPQIQQLHLHQNTANLIIPELGVSLVVTNCYSYGAQLLTNCYSYGAQLLMERSEDKPAEEQWSILRNLRASVPSEWRVEILPKIYLKEGTHTKHLLQSFEGDLDLAFRPEFDLPGPQNQPDREMAWLILAQMREETINRYQGLQAEHPVRFQQLQEWTISEFEKWREKNELGLEQGKEDA